MALRPGPVSGAPPIETDSTCPAEWRRKHVTSIQSLSSLVIFQLIDRPCFDSASVAASTTPNTSACFFPLRGPSVIVFERMTLTPSALNAAMAAA